MGHYNSIPVYIVPCWPPKCLVSICHHIFDSLWKNWLPSFKIFIQLPLPPMQKLLLHIFHSAQDYMFWVLGFSQTSWFQKTCVSGNGTTRGLTVPISLVRHSWPYSWLYFAHSWLDTCSKPSPRKKYKQNWSNYGRFALDKEPLKEQKSLSCFLNRIMFF